MDHRKAMPFVAQYTSIDIPTASPGQYVHVDIPLDKETTPEAIRLKIYDYMFQSYPEAPERNYKYERFKKCVEDVRERHPIYQRNHLLRESVTQPGRLETRECLWLALYETYCPEIPQTSAPVDILRRAHCWWSRTSQAAIPSMPDL